MGTGLFCREPGQFFQPAAGQVTPALHLTNLVAVLLLDHHAMAQHVTQEHVAFLRQGFGNDFRMAQEAFSCLHNPVAHLFKQRVVFSDAPG